MRMSGKPSPHVVACVRGGKRGAPCAPRRMSSRRTCRAAHRLIRFCFAESRFAARGGIAPRRAGRGVQPPLMRRSDRRA
ncbi:hypothetical protein WS69_25685 [Burkholderia sp. BDU5]|nr:hypothetical protein WS69_25685 [Burkholderia sp. BDU5]KVE47518.1 hypothetical protein WS70_27305 [Burkholderia mayonis]